MRYLTIAIAIILLGCTSQYKLFRDKIQDQNLFLEQFGDAEKVPPRSAVIVLSKGEFKGFGGCNDYNGTYTMDKNYIHFKINDIGTEVCDELYKEREYINQLVKTTNILIKGNRVLFTNKNKEPLLIYKK